VASNAICSGGRGRDDTCSGRRGREDSCSRWRGREDTRCGGRKPQRWAAPNLTSFPLFPRLQLVSECGTGMTLGSRVGRCYGKWRRSAARVAGHAERIARGLWCRHSLHIATPPALEELFVQFCRTWSFSLSLFHFISSACQSACLSACLFVFLSVCLSFCLSFLACHCLSLSLSLSVSVSLCLSLSLSPSDTHAHGRARTLSLARSLAACGRVYGCRGFVRQQVLRNACIRSNDS
jgi:hypothetical protein